MSNVFDKYNKLRSNKYVIALLNLIAHYESNYGVSGLDQYRVSWGNVLMDLKATAPRHPFPGGHCNTSTSLPRAVGRYQFCGFVWDEVLTYEGLEGLDFSNPVHQDVAALARIDIMRGKLEQVLSGDIMGAIQGNNGLAWEWAGLPPGRYPEKQNVPIQPALDMIAESIRDNHKLPSDGGDGTYKGNSSSSSSSSSSSVPSIETGPSSILGFNIETARQELCYSMRFCKVLGGFVPTKAERILGGNPSLTGFSPGSTTSSSSSTSSSTSGSSGTVKMGKFTPKEGYINPMPSGTFTSGYGWRWGRMHRGVDLAAPIGTEIMAAADGVVDFNEWDDSGFGNLLVIKHKESSPLVETYYGHMDQRSPFVNVGDKVKQGQVVGLSGSSGRSTGPHLHFEIHIDGDRIDPAPYIGL